MANGLVGKVSVTFLFIAPTEGAAEAVRLFFDGHANFMGLKSHEHGPLKLIQYYVSEGPEWVDDTPFFEGKWPEKTGRTIFTLNEVYETEDGLFHHHLESAELMPEVIEMLTTYNIELKMFNQLKVIHSLWD